MEAPPATVAEQGNPVISGGVAAPAPLVHRRGSGLWRVARLIVVLYVFVGALQILKTGAAAGLEVLTGGFLSHNAGSTLGLAAVR
jgi:hypothetical protein